MKTPCDPCEIRLSGTGGQGLLLAGLILAEAAAIYDNKNALQSQSYGPQARGGTSKAELIISSNEIDYPKVEHPDILLAMSQESADAYSRDIKRDAVVIVDSFFVTRLPARAIPIPITDIAREATGRTLTASMVALGIIAELTGVVSRQAAGLLQLSDRLLASPPAPQRFGIVPARLGIDGAGGHGLGQQVFRVLLLIPLQSRYPLLR